MVSGSDVSLNQSIDGRLKTGKCLSLIYHRCTILEMIVEYLSIVLVTINDTQMRMIADVFDRNTHVLQG